MHTPRAFLGLDFGTTNASVSYLLDDPRIAGDKIVRAQDVRFDIDDDGLQQSSRVPTLLAADPDDARGERVLTGWRCWQRLRDEDHKGRLLRHGEDYFRSVKSDLGTDRVYPRSFSRTFRTPERVAGRIMGDLLQQALGQMPGIGLEHLCVTLTVPASLGESARRATLEAAALAGLKREQVELIDEPVAALIDLLNDPTASGLLGSKPKTIALYDYGGGTLDITIVRAAFDPEERTGLRVHTLAISPYARLGGDVVDQAVMREVVWPAVERGLWWERDQLAAPLRQRIEDTLTPWVARGLKEALCRKATRRPEQVGGQGGQPVEARFPLPAQFDLGEGRGTLPCEYTLDDTQFQALLAPLIKSGGDGVMGRADLEFPALLKPLITALEVARLDPSELDAIVLHGGGCRNPYVRDLLESYVGDEYGIFGPTRIHQTPDLDASVAHGAAIASYWQHARVVTYVVPVIPEEIGVVTLSDKPVRLVEGGAPLPYPDEHGAATAETRFAIARHGQRKMLVPFYSGRQRPCRLVGTICVDLPPGLRQGDEVRLRVRVDADKTLHWWYAVKDGPFEKPTPLCDPWAPEVPTGTARQLQEHRGKLREAVEQGESLDAWVQIREASLLYRCGRLEEAELQLEEIGVPQDAEDAALWHNLRSLIWGSRGNRKKSKEHLEIAVAKRPGDAILRGNLGQTLYELGEDDAAIAQCRSALSRDGTLVYMHKTLADLYRRKGQEVAAVRELAEAKRLARSDAITSPDSPRVWHQLAGILQELGDYEGSQEARAKAGAAEKNERYGGDHTQRIAGPDSGYLTPEGVG